MVEDIPRGVRRNAKVGYSLSKVAFAFLKDRLGFSLNHERLAVELFKTLGSLKGPAMKVGQILATVPHILPDVYTEALGELGAHAPPMSPLFVKRRMTQELGSTWRKHFATFSELPCFAASLGQVHQGTLLDGARVAVKLQYPAMEAALESDFRNLQRFCKLYERYGGALSTANLEQELRERLFEELDYEREKQNMLLFQSLLAHDTSVRVPKPCDALTTKRLLTMSWLPGDPFKTLCGAPEALQMKLGSALFQAWWGPFYQAGVLHGDPHLGNYTVNLESGCLNILDFGCIRFFQPRVVEGMIDLFEGVQQHSSKTLKSAYEKIGFQKLSKPVCEALTLWAEFLYGPLLKDTSYHLKETFSSEVGLKIAREVHAKLSQEGGVAPPREFVLLDRAAVGIGSALMRLQVPFNLHRLFMKMQSGVSALSVDKEQKRQGLSPS